MMRLSISAIAALVSFLAPDTASLSVERPPTNPQKGLVDPNDRVASSNDVNRRDFFAAATAATVLTTTSRMAAAAEEENQEGFTLYTNPSGLKYIELNEGSGPTPRYGQLLSIAYTGYVKLPNKDKQKYDSNTLLIKHGNGRIVAGLDEGLHTMKEGGIRRIIIPPKLGYVRSGLGPLPEMPWARWRLNQLLDDMVAVKAGNVIFDVELRHVIDDEADQGYYEDGSLTPEEFERLRNNIQQKAANAIREGEEKMEGLSTPPPS